MSPQATLRVEVSGAERSFEPGTTVAGLIRSLGLQPELVAAEINRELVRRAEFEKRVLADGDRVELVEFVGGG
ncbi:MAG TPA: sulfur carrier protein ThiS [Thermoanaerobaculia bacterium]|nr:sulfur carrier protein ThiS [Thermoanaerobaculia bacterium]